LSLLTFVFVLAACSGAEEEAEVRVDDSVPTTTSTTEAEPADTSTSLTPPSTVYATDTLEGQIEADYLAAWDAFASACATADATELQQSYADAALGYRQQNIEDIVARGAVGECAVEHAYNIAIVGDDLAAVSDDYVNHMRLVDPESGSYLEPDPNVRDGSVYTLEKRDGTWIVVDINGLEPS
jgi:hypothetical protein